MMAPPLQRHSATDIIFPTSRPLTANLSPLKLKRASTIDGSDIIRMMNNNVINKPATRRMRTLAIPEEGGCLAAGNFMYVGPNPVIKKTTRMLRKSSSKNLKKKQQLQPATTKTIPKRASQTSLKKPARGRSRRGSLTTNSSVEVAMESNNVLSMPKAPRRKASNPFLRGGLVGQETTAKSLSPVPNSTATRSRRRRSPRRNLKASFSMDAHPRAPCRKASIQDMPCHRMAASSGPKPTNTRHNAPCMPNRKASNPFLRQGLVPTSEPIMTRSRSRQKMRQAASSSLSPNTRPSRKASIVNLQLDTPLVAPHRKASNLSLSTKQSFGDLQWDKLTLKDAANTTFYSTTANNRRVPRYERRKPTGMAA